MANEQNNTTAPPYSGPPMVKIDGKKIRRLREARGLTQLYLSTVVGVTTDTISRWENRRYQSIKLENGEKLAQALEISLTEIQEHPSQDKPDNLSKKSGIVDPPSAQLPARPRPIMPFVLGLILLVVVIGILTFSLLTKEQEEPVSAQRILPLHVPQGQSFPVLIQVRSHESDPVSLIIRESIPSECSVPQGVPPVTTVNRRDNSLKWISRTASGASVYAYICQLPLDVTTGALLIFEGHVTLKQDSGKHEPILGVSSVPVAPYHWADANQDSMIDDEEILAVYDLYSDIKDLPIDRDLIDNIWAGSGYEWNAEKKQYIVQE